MVMFEDVDVFGNQDLVDSIKKAALGIVGVTHDSWHAPASVERDASLIIPRYTAPMETR